MCILESVTYNNTFFRGLLTAHWELFPFLCPGLLPGAEITNKAQVIQKALEDRMSWISEGGERLHTILASD